LQDGLALLLVQLAFLLAEEPIDVGIAPVGIGAARGDEGLEAGRRIAEGAAGPLDEAFVLLLGVPLEKGRPLEGAQLGLDADRPQIVEDGFGDIGERGVTGIVSRVEAARIAGLG
jgi:hypothetical protein